MANSFLSPDGDLEQLFVNDYLMVDQYARTGSLWSWGNNQYGQLGNNGVTTGQSSPVQTISSGTIWKQSSTGYFHNASIKIDNTLWLWGRNTYYGQLGNNTTTNVSSPIQTVSGGTNWNLLSCGAYYTTATKTDATLWLWGRNNYGQLGDNTTTSKSSPIQTIAGGTVWKLVSASFGHVSAIKIDGSLWTWGRNNEGGLGDNTNTSKSSPIQTISGGTNWKQVSNGRFYSASIKTDGTLWLWGINTYGQLGDNTRTNTSSPIQTIAGGTNWKLVSAGSYHVAAIKTDGTLWLWGRNDNGQLGDNTRTNTSSPIQTISGGTNWKQIGTGAAHTGAIKTDGTLWAWGSNQFGAIGQVSASSSSPVQTIAGGSNWKQISCGYYLNAAIYFYDAGNLYPGQ